MNESLNESVLKEGYSLPIYLNNLEIPNEIWYLITIIFGIVVAMFKYDRILLNKKRHDAWKEVWDVKRTGFESLINELYFMAQVVADLHELSHVNIEKPNAKDSSNLLGWINLFEPRDKEKYPDEIKQKLASWFLSGGEIEEKNEFIGIYENIIRAKRLRAHYAFFRIQQTRQVLNLYVNNSKMLSELGDMANKTLESCNKRYGPDSNLDKFAEDFSSQLSPIIRQMKKELTTTIESKKVDLTLKKSSLDKRK